MIVRLVEPVTFPDVAAIIVVPVATDVAVPIEPAALLMAATEGADELHSTVEEISCVDVTPNAPVVGLTAVGSKNVPMAVNCWLFPRETLGLPGCIAID